MDNFGIINPPNVRKKTKRKHSSKSTARFKNSENVRSHSTEKRDNLLGKQGKIQSYSEKLGVSKGKKHRTQKLSKQRVTHYHSKGGKNFLGSSTKLQATKTKKTKLMSKESAESVQAENEGSVDAIKDDQRDERENRVKELTGRFDSSNKQLKDSTEEKTSSKVNSAANKEVESRTLFVGNVAVTVTKLHLLKYFSKYGKVEAVRLRSIAPTHPGASKRLAVIKKLIHPKRSTLHAYVVFENREDAVRALSANGVQYKEHHLRVQLCDDSNRPNPNKAIFVGNLPFDVEDDDLWAAFESCGPIISVRVVRNASTGMGIGTGYVNFESADSVELALQEQQVVVRKHEVRIQRYQAKKMKKEKRQGQTKEHPGVTQPNQQNVVGTTHRKQKSTCRANTAHTASKNNAFQGSKFNQKKQKRKVNKGLLQKLKMSQKIAPRVVH